MNLRLSSFIPIISLSRLRCQIHANSSGVEFLKALSKFREPKKICSSLLVFNTSSMKNMKGIGILFVHETIRNDDFKRAAWKVGAMLQPFETMSQQRCYAVLLLGCFDNSNSRVETRLRPRPCRIKSFNCELCRSVYFLDPFTVKTDQAFLRRIKLKLYFVELIFWFNIALFSWKL